MNGKLQLQFLTQLSEFLFCGMNIRESLNLMCAKISEKQSAKKLSLAAKEILDLVENGTVFSNALRYCEMIKFDSVTISFAAVAEETGKISETAEFLRKRLEEKKETATRLINALLYPIFVISITFAGGIIFALFANQIASSVYAGSAAGSENFQIVAAAGLVRAVLFLVAICIFCIFLFYKLCVFEKEFDVFSALNFLTKANVRLSFALESALVISKIDSSLGRKIALVKSRIDSGMLPSLSFADVFNSEVTQLMFTACHTGKENEMFSYATGYIKRRNDLYWKRIMSLAEPFFVISASICFLLIASSTLLPILSNMGVGY